MSSPSVVSLTLETSALVAFRAGVFFAARRYLLQSLYHDLQGLSSETEPLTATLRDDVELDALPTPSTAGLTPKEYALASRRRPLHSTISRATFALCLSESLTLFILLMCQALDVLHPQTRLLNWQISLCILLLLIVILIPFSYSLVLSYRSASGLQGIQRPTLARLGLYAVPIGVFLFFLSFIPVPEGAVARGIIGTVLVRLIAAGTVILGALSGFGAVDNATRYLPWFSRQGKPPTQDDILVAQEGLARVRNDLAERRRSIERMQSEQPKADTSWLSRVTSSLSGSSEMSSALQELAGLEALEYQMARNLDALQAQHRAAAYAQTLRGQLMHWGGLLFALYCVYRIIVAIANLALPRRRTADTDGRTADVLAVTLAYALALAPGVHVQPERAASAARSLSLALAGAIIASSIRLVLRGAARALRVASRSLGASLMLLILAQLVGIYLLTTLVQLRTSFPPPPARPDAPPANLFATLPEYHVFGALFDSALLVTAGASAVVAWFSHRINSVGVIEA
ncbi:abscisic acid G-protein coupled receptor-domain-containing protein [Phanerochaete sordida]|uniref:Abscisic acid G-protein coupled receptor-domain-containing protein n=1 Tax=Phanerochaete sordida TaxID=48140 RepID=A0A9P3G6T5_9APHY|nr:abscisic acid G-protein coupled receptor-domain-containing protein [Phanerochaete sordida]